MLIVVIIIIAVAVYLVSRLQFERKLIDAQQILTQEFHQHTTQKDFEHNQNVIKLNDQFADKISAIKEEFHKTLSEKDKESYQKEKENRVDAIKRSKQVVTGQVYEQISPLVPGFPYDLKDARHVGNPLDFIIFKGLNDENYDLEIIFLEIKSGSSNLNANERRVRNAVQAGRVRYDVFHPDAQHDLSTELEASLDAVNDNVVVPLKTHGPPVGVYDVSTSLDVSSPPGAYFIDPGPIDENEVPPSAIIAPPNSGDRPELETLTCDHCKKSFERVLTPGRKPMFCPRCRGTAS